MRKDGVGLQINETKKTMEFHNLLETKPHGKITQDYYFDYFVTNFEEKNLLYLLY